MTREELTTQFDFSPVKPEYRERVINAIHSQIDIIEACTGFLANAKQITYCMLCPDGLLESASNFRFDSGGWADDVEQVIANRK